MRALTTSWVVPVASPPVQDGCVVVDGDRVSWVGPREEYRGPAQEVTELGPGVLLPGLVNAHCHLELSHLQGRLLPAAGFVPWVRKLVAARDEGDDGAPRRAVQEAIRSLEEGGTVALGDVSNALAHLDLLGASPLRVVVFYEVVGWDPDRAPEIMAQAEERLRAVGRRPHPNVEVRLAAHAPHSVSAPLFERLRRAGGPASLHLAESTAEARFLADGDREWSEFLESRVGPVAFVPPGSSPVLYAASLGILRPPLLAVHCVQVDARDREALSRSGVHVVLCPRSNRALGVGSAPLPDLLRDGVRLCLGTDSLASSPSLNVLDDAVALRKEFPDVEPAAILRMATLGGAQALGLDGLGAIVPGRRAALAFAPAEESPEKPIDFLLSGEARLTRIAA